MGKTYLKKCCVPNCFNVKNYNCYKTGDDKATHNYSFRLFKFPKDPKRRRKWLKLIGLPEMDIKTSTRICSHHFTKEDYFEGKKIKIDNCSVGRKCLRRTAEPSKWLPEVPENEEDNSEEEEDDGEPCLICGGEIKGGKRKRRRYKFDGGEGLKLLNEQLWSTFILRDVLKVGEDKFGEILGLVGASVQPGKWFGICEDCEGSVFKILGCRKAIRKLEGTVEETEGILKRKLEDSLEKEEKGNGLDEILNVRREIRKWFKYKDGLSLKKEEIEKGIKKEIVEDKQDDNFNCDGEDFNEDWLKALAPAELEEKMEKTNEITEDKQEDDKHSDSSSDSDSDSEYKPEVKKKPANQLKRINKLNRRLKLNPGLQGKPKQKRKSKAKPKPSCNLCSYKAWSPTKMERHIINHKIFDNSVDPSISTTQFYCNLCPTSPTPSLFPTRPHLLRHKRINHPTQLNLTIYQCPLCPESFFYKASYSNHLFKKHPTHYQSTLSTNPTTITEPLNSDHHQNDNPQPPPTEAYLCDKCNYSTLIKHEMTRHVTHAHTGIPFICPHCSATYKYSWTVDKHIRRYHPEDWTGPKRHMGVPIEDDKDKPISWEDNHKQGKNPKKEKPVNCNYCKEGGAQFPHKLALNLHLKEAHKDLFQWQCNLCDKSYLRRQSLQTHLKINHLESGLKGKCEWCGTEVQHKTYLYSHWRVCLKRPSNGVIIGEEGTEIT